MTIVNDLNEESSYKEMERDVYDRKRNNNMVSGSRCDVIIVHYVDIL